jgi:hypothetical protein
MINIAYAQEIVWRNRAGCDTRNPLKNFPLRTSTASLVTPKRLATYADALGESCVRDLILGEVCREVHAKQHVTNTVTAQASSHQFRC